MRPLFAAERQRLIDAIQEVIGGFGAAGGDRRQSLIDRLRRDAHRLKGLADVETRDDTSVAVTELERRIDLLAAAPASDQTQILAMQDAVTKLLEIDGDRRGR